MKRLKRGDIYYADLGPIIGSEQHGYRPVIIIQNNKGNKHSPTTIIAPTTSKKKNRIPTHVFVQNSNLPYDSIIMLEQLKAIDKKRLDDYIGTLTDEEMNAIDKALAISVGLKIGGKKNEQGKSH